MNTQIRDLLESKTKEIQAAINYEDSSNTQWRKIESLLIQIWTAQQIDELMDSEISYGDFFRQAPAMNPNQEKITGVVCGVRVENVENSLMRDIRYLDKLVDELAKGKAMEKILRE